jgi:hypothetical protein
MDNINLIRKITWQYFMNSGMDFDELFGEASVAYYEALETYDPDKGSLSSYVWNGMSGRLCNVLTREKRYTYDSLEYEDCDDDASHTYSNEPYVLPNLFFEVWEELGDQAKQVASMVLADPYNYLDKSPKLARGQIVQELRGKGWSWSVIWKTLGELKTTLNEN